MKKDLTQVLLKVTEAFNKASFTWAVGASMVLNHYEIVDQVNDIDIVISCNDVKMADQILSSLGKKQETHEITTYNNEYFGNFIVDGVEIDMMSGLLINNHGCHYLYPFDKSSVVDYKDIDGYQVPMTSLEEWYILYQMIPGRHVKVKLLEDYLKKEGVINRRLLERALDADLPDHTKKNIKVLLDR